MAASARMPRDQARHPIPLLQPQPGSAVSLVLDAAGEVLHTQAATAGRGAVEVTTTGAVYLAIGDEAVAGADDLVLSSGAARQFSIFEGQRVSVTRVDESAAATVRVVFLR